MEWTLKNKRTGFSYNEEDLHAVLKKNGQVSYLSFPSLEKFDFIRHGFSTKEGGVSTGHLATMNLSYSRGDNPELVDENFRRICEALKFDTKNLVLSDQVHDTKVVRVGKKDCQGRNLREKKLKGIDGLVTNEKDVVLCTSYADCVPLYLVDAKKKAIGHSHSGWRGTVGKIGAVTVKQMQQEFGSCPQDLWVVVGPSICQECYEVSEDVKDAFYGFVDAKVIAERQHISVDEAKKMIDSVCVAGKPGKYQLDLWMANKLIFMEAGIPQKQIAISCVCTCCNADLLFSHRATKGQRGNLAGFLSLF